jgi:hypothetical protein
MLANKKLKAFVSTVKPSEAKIFYKDILGLGFLSEDNYALEFNANGTLLRVSIVPELKPQLFTVLGWNVEDISATIKSLNKRELFVKNMIFSHRIILEYGHLPMAQKLHGLKILMEIFFH